MEKLATCSKQLYDKDILDKSNEIALLKKQLEYYKFPKNMYNNLEDFENNITGWHATLEKTKLSIKKAIQCYIMDDPDIWSSYEEDMEGPESGSLYNPIKTALSNLVNNQKCYWVESTTYQICNHIISKRNFIEEIKPTDGQLVTVYQDAVVIHDANKLVDILYNSVLEYFCTEDDGWCVHDHKIHDIGEFICNNCSKVVSSAGNEENGFCWQCYEC